MVSVHRPHTLIELAMARSILAAHDIPYFVHNGGYASLHPGMQIGLLNVPTVMVPPSAAQFARRTSGFGPLSRLSLSHGSVAKKKPGLLGTEISPTAGDRIDRV